MKKSLFITGLTLSLVLVLASCATSEPSTHSMDDGSNMNWVKHVPGDVHTDDATHDMNNWKIMSGATHTDADVHPMKDSSPMKGSTHMDETESQ